MCEVISEDQIQKPVTFSPKVCDLRNQECLESTATFAKAITNVVVCQIRLCIGLMNPSSRNQSRFRLAADIQSRAVKLQMGRVTGYWVKVMVLALTRGA